MSTPTTPSPAAMAERLGTIHDLARAVAAQERMLAQRALWQALLGRGALGRAAAASAACATPLAAAAGARA